MLGIGGGTRSDVLTFSTKKRLSHPISQLLCSMISLRRTHHDVQASILKSCVFDGLSISQLLAWQNLSYKILKPALDHLVSCKLLMYEADGRRKLVRTTEKGLVAFQAYENALTLLEGRQISVELNEAAGSLGDRRWRSRNIVVEQKNRTILPRPIIIE